MKTKKFLITAVTVLLSVALLGICLWFTFRTSIALPGFKSTTRVWRNLTTNVVSAAYSPVIIYRYYPIIRSGRPVGVGTVFRTSAGEERLLTAAHIFGKRRMGSTFAFSRLRPLGTPQTRIEGIEAFVPLSSSDGYQGKEVSDFALCMVGEPKPLGWLSWAEQFLNFRANFAALPVSRQFSVTSLVSGKRVPAVAATKPAADGLCTFLVIYSAVSGESGTGFVDSANQLFILTGQVHLPLASPARFLGASNEREECAFSVLVGPFKQF